MRFSALLVLPLLAFSVLPSYAQYGTPGVDARQERQQERIVRGVQSGELTRQEERRLERQQNRMQRMENRAKADGVVTPQERHRLQKAQNHNSRAIYRAKHNGRVR